jgi:hypothetical protein
VAVKLVAGLAWGLRVVFAVTIHPNSNRGTENNNQNNFDANGNLLNLNKPRLLLGWMVRVCCQVLLFAWCER